MAGKSSNKNTMKNIKSACRIGIFLLGNLTLAVASFAQTAPFRVIPADTFWGKGLFVDAYSVKIEGRTFTYAPAVFIRNQQNMLISPLAATEQANPTVSGFWGDRVHRPLVRFGLNSAGQVDRVWVLTDAERDQALERK